MSIRFPIWVGATSVSGSTLTEEERKSAIGFRLWPFFHALPAGDGTVSQADRQQATGLYAGILAGGAPAGDAGIMTLNTGWWGPTFN